MNELTTPSVQHTAIIETTHQDPRKDPVHDPLTDDVSTERLPLETVRNENNLSPPVSTELNNGHSSDSANDNDLFAEKTPSKDSHDDDSGVTPVKRKRTESELESQYVETKPADNGRVTTPQAPPVVTPEDFQTRTSRRSRKKSLVDRPSHLCPVCGITIRPGGLATHLSFERDRADKLSRAGKKSGIKGAAQCSGKVHPASSSSGSISHRNCENDDQDGQSELTDPTERYETYLRIKNARQMRLCATSRQRKKAAEETLCPVCDKSVSANPEELNEHIDLCLRKREAEDAIIVDVDGDGDDVDLDVDVDETYEEYEWAGQTRIRTTTLLPGGLAASGFPTVTKATPEEEDVDLDVDGDDEKVFGQPQYCEKDIIPSIEDDPDENKEKRALRRAFLKTELQSVDSEPSDRSRWESNTSKGKSKGKKARHTPNAAGEGPSSQPGDSEDEEPYARNTEEIIESLKAKIRDQEEMLGQERPKCLICMEPHQIPVTSTQCWHVHCEECWLRSLGAKKVCPQCNIITHPTDLRRIYL